MTRESPLIVGVGHNCLDQLCTVEDYPPEDGSTHITSITVQGGGAVATALAAAARLGCPSAMVGRLGDDPQGDQIVDLLAQDGVCTDYISRVPAGRSSVSFVMIHPSHGTRTKFPYPDQLPPLDFSGREGEVIRQAKVLHLDGTRYENALRAAELAKSAGVTVSLDGCSMQKDNKKNRLLASMADILIMNAKYPTRVSGAADDSQALLEMASWGPKVVIGTQGGSGCLAVLDGRVVHFPAFPVSVVDTTGAGDVFHGAFLAGWVSGMALADNIRFAAAAAALKCTKIGGRAGIPTKEQTLAFLAQHP